MSNKKFNFKEISKSKGYITLKEAIIADCYNKRSIPKHRKYIGNFNITGCGKECKVTHNPCNQFKWIIDRAKHYSIKTEVPLEDILNAWESNRSYCFQNYYQDGQHPKLTNKDVLVFETKDSFVESIGGPKFRCPSCNKVSKDAYECTEKPCNWKAYGLFGTMGKGISIFLKEDASMHRIFMPVEYEKGLPSQAVAIKGK